MSALAWIGLCLGGAAGAMLRAWLTHLGNGRAPWGTLGVNWLGSALLGLTLALGGQWPEPLRLAVATGICGALTTFSTCLVEAAKWWRAGLWARAVAYLAATFGGSIGLILLALDSGPRLP